MEAMEAERIPSNRVPPWPLTLLDNRYVDNIRTMRKDIKDSKDPHSGQPLGPIGHALQHIPNFACSASEWTRDHLRRFQIVVLQDTPSSALFPDEYIIEDNDKTMKALKDQKFFTPDVRRIGHGEWDQNSIHHDFFGFLMMLLRGDDRTPSPQTSPPQRVLEPRDAKEKAIYEIMRANESLSSLLPPKPSGGSSNSYTPTMASVHSQSFVDYGPRESATFMMMQNFLMSLGTVEFKTMKKKTPLWMPNPNSSRYPVVAGGQQFTTENDGSIHPWTHRKSGLRKHAVLPLCSLEFKREWHFKPEDSICAQEAAELIALASQNFVSEKPLPRPRDEVFLICCHNTTVHISAAIVSDDYIQGIVHDNLPETQYLFLKRGAKYDLLDPDDRRQACRQILALLRYLTSTPEN